METHYLETLDWGILITYFVILFGIGIWAGTTRKKGSSLFLAENSLKWPTIGFSMWGTNVGPSMLIASASAGFTTGIVSGNFAWYAFVFIFLLAFVFAPRYLGAKVITLPEFMGKRFGQSTRNMLAWYTIVTILISWLALTLFAGGILIKQIFDIPMWQSAVILLLISAFFTILGGLKAVAYTNVFQMLLLIFVSLTLTIVGLNKVGGVSALYEAVPQDYWNLFQPNDNPDFPWLPILLGYPVMGVWFWCTDQSMVQPVLAAKNLEQGQLGANFTGWLKILDVPLYILPGIICLALYPTLQNPDEAYMTMVTNLFPTGMVGLVMAVLTAALVSTIGSALNALSTVFTMDIYVKRINPDACQSRIIKTGRMVTVAGAVISILITIAIDSIKGLNLFNVFQSVLGFIAPPMAAVFLLGVFWKKTTTRAANMALTLGTAFSLIIGVLYLWVIPAAKGFDFWPHFMMLSFLIFVVIVAAMIIVSTLDRKAESQDTLDFGVIVKPTKRVVVLWAALIVVMLGLYLFFNGF
ncbi:sodium:solute symporter [Bacteroides sp. 224]|uniref:sodium:solute symporter n=1 Tax=Bacteroides sp. 224 TaxID=2302936 RepID=UPI0013D262D6|nr:sodium:solute symporter [Bacteroides sp. 224]NDV64737.1 Na+/glucose cotransporter [Bacteroides sp. 224]